MTEPILCTYCLEPLGDALTVFVVPPLSLHGELVPMHKHPCAAKCDAISTPNCAKQQERAA